MACSCKNGNNQTSVEAREAVRKSNTKLADAKGAGLFIVPDPRSGAMRFEKIVVHDLTYIDCQLRGANCEAFRWVPYAYKARQDIDEGIKIDCDFDTCFEDSGLCRSWQCICRHNGECI